MAQKQRVETYIDRDDVELIEELADEKDMSRSQWMREAAKRQAQREMGEHKDRLRNALHDANTLADRLHHDGLEGDADVLEEIIQQIEDATGVER
jgi:uncharacterized protein (DUF1778 family)